MADDIDAEQLQASFDLSIAAIHDVAASWVTPSAASTSRRNTQKELEDYMKRPARLGVGAPLPVSTPLTQGTARLKSQLANQNSKKRQHEDLRGPTDSGDEEESRAGAINKKIKKDPFATGTVAYPRIASGQFAVETIQEDSIPPGDAVKRGKKKKNKTKIQASPTDDTAQLLTPTDQYQHSESSPQSPVHITNQSLNAIEKSTISSEPIAEDHLILTTLPPVDTASNRLTKADTNIPVTPALHTPVLNLDGPPEGDNPIHSPKKKRKRRKKKKGLAQDPDTSNV